ncbi:unnamed protein product, partial [Ectocarpus sp. 4 AP-2014]
VVFVLSVLVLLGQSDGCLLPPGTPSIGHARPIHLGFVVSFHLPPHTPQGVTLPFPPHIRRPRAVRHYAYTHTYFFLFPLRLASFLWRTDRHELSTPLQRTTRRTQPSRSRPLPFSPSL